MPWLTLLWGRSVRSSLPRILTPALWLLLGLGYVGAAGATAITVVTEELPPYNMTVGGKLTGMGAEVMQAVLEEAGEQTYFQPMPWARAYDIALSEPNIWIYLIARRQP